MRKSMIILALCAITILLFGFQQPDDLSKDRAAIMKLQNDFNQACLAGDVKTILSLLKDEQVLVENGLLTQPNLADLQTSFTEDFSKTKYLAIRDLVEPIIHISPNGKMAWVAGTTEYDSQSKDPNAIAMTAKTVNSWLAVLEKKADKWVYTAYAISFR